MNVKLVLKITGVAALGYGVFTAGRIYEVVHLSRKAFKLIKKIWDMPIPSESKEEDDKNDDACEEPKTIKLVLDEETYNAIKKAVEEAQ